MTEWLPIIGGPLHGQKAQALPYDVQSKIIYAWQGYSYSYTAVAIQMAFKVGGAINIPMYIDERFIQPLQQFINSADYEYELMKAGLIL